ncbi:MAG: peptidoglycan bridge formation glycyltransferase FemA/FemB family protein [bacterium]
MHYSLKYPKYFFQSQTWVNFAVQALGSKHEILKFTQSLPDSNLDLEVFVYQYPWHLKQNLWYIPRFPGFDIDFTTAYNKISDSNNLNDSLLVELQNQLKTAFTNLLKKILKQAKSTGITFLKLDFDDQICNILGITSNQELLTFLKKQGVKLPVEISKKIIQYTGTMTLDLELVENVAPENQTKQIGSLDFLTEGLKNFYEKNSKYFLSWEKNTRRLTKHALDRNWQVSISKTKENFEGFYGLLKDTSIRQNFAVQPKNYLQSLFDKDFSRIIVLKDQQGEAQAAWFGIVTENTLTNLYAGNSQASLKDNGQYLMHLAAIKLGLDEKLKFYDMGGYNPKLSFGKFKDGYKGEVRSFLGPIDILIKPNRFKLSNFIVRLAKTILGKKDYEY